MSWKSDLLEENVERVGTLEENILRRAVSRYGVYAQVFMIFEEVGELLAAIGQHQRNRVPKENVIEEIADVGIMLDQLILILDAREEVEQVRAEKLAKLHDRLRPSNCRK